MSMVRFSAACPCPDLLKGTQPTRPGERLTTVGRRFWPGFTGCGCRHVENAGAASSLNQGPDEHWRTAILSHIRRFDHVGISVADLDTVIGMPESRTRIVMLRPPDGGTGIELSSFVRPDHEPGSPTAMANELGLRNVCFEVHDLQAAVDRLAADGYGLVGGIGQHEHIWRMAYVRGPEGIIVSLAERMG
jgi:catechol 2,3-dioxygenase-like lactoylglutathione lyase family enzyme